MGRNRGIVVAQLFLLVLASAPAQVGIAPLGLPELLFPTDAAVLEASDTRQDLVCTVTHAAPELGFDLRFHVAYAIRIPLKELAGPEDQLRTLLRVTPLDRPGRAIHLRDRIRVPPVAEGIGGEATLENAFIVGEGRYRVDWLMRDRGERVCSAHWDFTAQRPDGERQLALPPDTAASEPPDPFYEEPPLEREPRGAVESPVRVKILFNYSPQRAEAAAMPAAERDALLAILRGIARDRRIASFSLVAFNMNQRRVLFRQSDAPRIDFPALGAAIDGLKLALVDYRQLQEKDGNWLFLQSLLEQELARSEEASDAVIFVGPKVMLDQEIENGKTLRSQRPVFYMNYNSNRLANPWRDAIGTLVKKLGGRVYTISRPKELGAAWRDIIGRIVDRRS